MRWYLSLLTWNENERNLILYCLQLRVWGTWYPALVLCQTILPPAQGLRDLMPGSGPLSDYIASSSGFEGLDTRLWSFVRLYCLQLRVWGTWCLALVLCQIILPSAQGLRDLMPISAHWSLYIASSLGLRDLMPGSSPVSDYIASSSGFEGLDARLWSFVRLYCLQLRVWGTWCLSLLIGQTILPPARGLRDLMHISGPWSDFIAPSSGFEGLDTRLWSFVRLYCLQLRVWGTWCLGLVLCQIILPPAQGLRDLMPISDHWSVYIASSLELRDLMPGSAPMSDYIAPSLGFEGFDAWSVSLVKLFCLSPRFHTTAIITL